MKFVLSLYRLALWCPPFIWPWVLCGRHRNCCKWDYALLHSIITEVSDAKEDQHIKPKISSSPEWKCNTHSSITVQLQPSAFLSSLNAEKEPSGEKRVFFMDHVNVWRSHQNYNTFSLGFSWFEVDIIKWFVEVSTVSLASDMSEGMKMCFKSGAK